MRDISYYTRDENASTAPVEGVVTDFGNTSKASQGELSEQSVTTVTTLPAQQERTCREIIPFAPRGCHGIVASDGISASAIGWCDAGNTGNKVTVFIEPNTSEPLQPSVLLPECYYDKKPCKPADKSNDIQSWISRAESADANIRLLKLAKDFKAVRWSDEQRQLMDEACKRRQAQLMEKQRQIFGM